MIDELIRKNRSCRRFHHDRRTLRGGNGHGPELRLGQGDAVAPAVIGQRRAAAQTPEVEGLPVGVECGCGGAAVGVAVSEVAPEGGDVSGGR